MDVLVSLQGIHKVFQVGTTPLRVLRDVSLEVEAGEALAIVGPSGAGKSTLLHIMGALDRPTRGTVLFRGRDVYALSQAERTVLRGRQIGFVFQFYHLLPEMDVLENVRLPAMARRGAAGSGGDVRQRALMLLEAVGLSARAHHTPRELSGGEQQRAALARALMNDPGLVLADEPTGNLDTATGEQVLRQLFALTRQKGHTLVLVTHNVAVAATCDRMVRLVDGRIQ